MIYERGTLYLRLNSLLVTTEDLVIVHTNRDTCHMHSYHMHGSGYVWLWLGNSCIVYYIVKMNWYSLDERSLPFGKLLDGLARHIVTLAIGS